MSNQILWYAARVAAMTAYGALALSLLSGMALRSALLAPLARNRAVLELHRFLTWIWVPLVGAHVTCLILDSASQVRPLDTVYPFQVSYARVPIGLGTVGLLMLAFVAGTGALRKHMNPRLWRWCHRLSYPMFAVFLVHAQLAGSDFSRAAIGISGWATGGALLALSVPLALGGRVRRGGEAAD